MKIKEITNELEHLRRNRIVVKCKKDEHILILYTRRKGNENLWEYKDNIYTRGALQFLQKNKFNVILNESNGKIEIVKE